MYTVRYIEWLASGFSKVHAEYSVLFSSSEVGIVIFSSLHKNFWIHPRLASFLGLCHLQLCDQVQYANTEGEGLEILSHVVMSGRQSIDTQGVVPNRINSRCMSTHPWYCEQQMALILLWPTALGQTLQEILTVPSVSSISLPDVTHMTRSSYVPTFVHSYVRGMYHSQCACVSN